MSTATALLLDPRRASADILDDDDTRRDVHFLGVLERLTRAWADGRTIDLRYRSASSGEEHPYRMGIYRDKDVVEKGFHRIKHSLGLERLRVHSQQAMESKVFIGLIALILSSHIHRVMLGQNLYKTLTMKELIRTMEKLRTQVIDRRRILFPMTKRQREIYHAFGVAPPVYL